MRRSLILVVRQMHKVAALTFLLSLSACTPYNNFKFSYDQHMREDNYIWFNRRHLSDCLAATGETEDSCKSKSRSFFTVDSEDVKPILEACTNSLAAAHGKHYPRRKAWPLLEKCMEQKGWGLDFVLD